MMFIYFYMQCRCRDTKIPTVLTGSFATVENWCSIACIYYIDVSLLWWLLILEGFIQDFCWAGGIAHQSYNKTPQSLGVWGHEFQKKFPNETLKSRWVWAQFGCWCIFMDGFIGLQQTTTPLWFCFVTPELHKDFDSFRETETSPGRSILPLEPGKKLIIIMITVYLAL